MTSLQPVLTRLAIIFSALLILAPGPLLGEGLESSFEARFAGQQAVDGENTLAVTFSKALDSKQDLTPYFSLSTGEGEIVEGAWILAEDPSVVYFTHIEPDTSYKIEIFRGLKAEAGDVFEDELVYEITTRSAEPMIVFGSRGFILASKLTKGLPVDSLNIKQADIDFFRIKPGKIGAFKESFWSNRSTLDTVSSNRRECLSPQSAHRKTPLFRDT